MVTPFGGAKADPYCYRSGFEIAKKKGGAYLCGRSLSQGGVALDFQSLTLFGPFSIIREEPALFGYHWL
jgi:hypothetical protein